MDKNRIKLQKDNQIQSICLRDKWFQYVLVIIRWTKRILKIGIMFLIFQFIICILNYIYVDEDPWYRILWHHYYQDEGKIDNLYLGSSHVYCDINPEQLDRINNQYNFNMATPSQCLNGSYYLLKEASYNNKLSHVYLELYYISSTTDNFNGNIDPIDSKENYNKNWQNTDYMKNSLNKLIYMNSIGSINDYPAIFFPFTRFREHLDDWEYVRQTIDKKKKDSYKSYEYFEEYADGNGYGEYFGQGFFFSTRNFFDENRIYEQERILSEKPMGKISEYYLKKIITHCKKENIPITLFISPIDELQLISTEGYDYYIDQLKNIAKEYEVDFYDFNLAKEIFLPIRKGQNFRDIGHLNYSGACLYTPFFEEVVSGTQQNAERFFYSSYEEKIMKSSPEIYGLYYKNFMDSTQIRKLHIASNRNEGMEYRISVVTNEGKEYIVQDFCTNKSFELPADEHGVCVIASRLESDPGEQIQTLKINY
nr:hypothetical protein [uncultured Schaedlerella sp.]